MGRIARSSSNHDIVHLLASIKLRASLERGLVAPARLGAPAPLKPLCISEAVRPRARFCTARLVKCGQCPAQ